MDKFKVTLVKQSRKPDPKTGRKKRTKRVISDNKPTTFNIKIKKGEEEMKINMNENLPNNSSYDFKVKIHKGEEVNESSTSDFRDPTKETFSFNARIMKNEPEEEQVVCEEEPISETIPTEVEEENIEEYGETEEEDIPSTEEVYEEDSEDVEEEPVEEESVEEDEYLPDDADEIEDESSEEETSEEEYYEPEEESRELEEAGIDESVFDTVTVNGEVMNAVELNPEEGDYYDDETPPYEEYDDDMYEDLIPSKFKGDDEPKRRNKKGDIRDRY